MPDLKQRPFIPNRRPTPRLKGMALNPNAAIEDRYYQAMAKLINQMADEVETGVRALFQTKSAQEYFAQDETVSAEAKKLTQAFFKKFAPVFNLAAKPTASAMAYAENASSAKSVHASLQRLAGGLTLKPDILTGELKDILTATIAENVALIKSIPQEYLTQVQGAVMRSITTGNGMADLVPELQKQHGITLRRARIIARDQTHKAFSNLNFSRLEKAGVMEYEWLHSGGSQKPRKLHQRMSGNIYRVDRPPIIDEKTGIRGKPGDLINCNCRAIPILKFDKT